MEARDSASRVPVVTRQPWRGLLILTLYGYQGLMAGFALTAIPNLAAGSGASVAAVGAYVALVGLPWTFQPLWGPLVDRYGASRMGRRRPWLVAGLAGSLVTLLLVAALSEGRELLALGPLLFLHSCCASLVDTALDGMIMDRVRPERLGNATALTRTGFALGTALGAAGFAWAIPALGVPGAATLLVGLAAVAASVALLVREQPGDALLSFGRAPAREGGAPGFSVLLRGLRDSLLRPGALALLALCVVEEFVVAVFGLRLSVALVQEGGWQPAALSHLQGMLALAGGTAGALLVGWWSDRIGHRRALVLLLAACAAAHLGAAALVWNGIGAGGAWALGLSAVLPALMFVALAPVIMLDRGGAAATRFAVFMAALNMGGVAGAAAAGEVGALLTPAGTALLAASVFGVAALAFARAWLPRV